MLLGTPRLKLERNKLKEEIRDRQRKVDLITTLIKEHPNCSFTYSQMFMSWVDHSDFSYDKIISEIGVDKWFA